MSDALPSNYELQRRIDGLESTVEANRSEARLDQADLKADMATGFDKIMDRLERLDIVSPEVFAESQRRQDAERERQDAEITWLRRTIVFGFLFAIAVQVTVQVVPS